MDGTQDGEQPGRPPETKVSQYVPTTPIPTHTHTQTPLTHTRVRPPGSNIGGYDFITPH